MIASVLRVSAPKVPVITYSTPEVFRFSKTFFTCDDKLETEALTVLKNPLYKVDVVRLVNVKSLTRVIAYVIGTATVVTIATRSL